MYVYQYVNSLQHKGTMSTKPVFEKISNIKGCMSHYVNIRHLIGKYYNYHCQNHNILQ